MLSFSAAPSIHNLMLQQLFEEKTWIQYDIMLGYMWSIPVSPVPRLEADSSWHFLTVATARGRHDLEPCLPPHEIPLCK